MMSIHCLKLYNEILLHDSVMIPRTKPTQRHLMFKINYLTISFANKRRFYEIFWLILDVGIENNG